jgi:hypothetical protein
MRPNWFLSLWSIWGKTCTYVASRLTLSPNGSKQASIWPLNLRVPSGMAKMNCMPLVHSVKTMQLSEINTISKWTKMSFHLTHVTLEFHQVCQKQFLSLLHVWRKSCTNLLWILTLSLNELKCASTWPTLPRSPIRCAQNNFWAYCTFGTNRAPILCGD